MGEAGGCGFLGFLDERLADKITVTVAAATLTVHRLPDVIAEGPAVTDDPGTSPAGSWHLAAIDKAPRL